METKKNWKKIFNSKWFAPTLTVTLIGGSLGILFWIGYEESKSKEYDYTVAVSSKTNMNNVTGLGSVTRATNSFVKGWTTTAITDAASTSLVLGSPDANGFFDPSTFDPTQYWTTPEAMTVWENLVPMIQPEANGTLNLDPKAQDLQTYEVVSTTELEPTSDLDPKTHSGASRGYYPPTVMEDLAEEMFVSKDATNNTSSLRIYLHDFDNDEQNVDTDKDGINDDVDYTPTKWSSGNDLTVTDFIFGIGLVGTQTVASAQNYMYGFSGIINIGTGEGEWQDVQSSQDFDPNLDGNQTMPYEQSIEWFNDNIVYAIDEESVSNPWEYGIWYSEEDQFVQYNFTTAKSVDYFLGMLHSIAFSPIDQEYFETKADYYNLGVDAYATQKYGSTDKDFSSYGPFQMTSFDGSYGYTGVKNENYRYKAAMPIDDILFRVVEEPSTAVAEFNLGTISQIYGQELTSPLYSIDEGTKFWDNSVYDGPTSRFLLFNLDPTINAPNSEFFKNPNFRRTINAALNRQYYHTFTNNVKSFSSSMVTADRVGLYESSNGTVYAMEDLIENYLIDVQNPNYDANSSTGTSSGITAPTENDLKLNEYNSSERQAALGDTNGIRFDDVTGEEYEDPLMNQNLVGYYWSLFLEQMSQIENTTGTTVKEENGELVGLSSGMVKLEFKTKKGDKDEVVKMVNLSLDEAFALPENQKYQVDGQAPIEVVPVKVNDTSTPFQNGDFQMLDLGWNPDYNAAYSSQVIYTSTDLTRSYNNTGGWNYWTGSLFTFGFQEGQTYSGADNNDSDSDGITDMQEIITWADDGVLTMNGFTLNSFDTNGDETVDPYTVTYANGTNYLAGLFHTITLSDGTNLDLLADYEQLEAAANTSFQNPTTSSWLTIEQATNSEGVNYVQVTGPTQGQVDLLSLEEQMSLGVIFEIIVKSSAPSIAYRNALIAVNPTRGTFQQSPMVGYPTFGFVYDCEFPPFKGLPTTEDVLNARGK